RERPADRDGAALVPRDLRPLGGGLSGPGRGGRRRSRRVVPRARRGAAPLPRRASLRRRGRFRLRGARRPADLLRGDRRAQPALARHGAPPAAMARAPGRRRSRGRRRGLLRVLREPLRQPAHRLGRARPALPLADGEGRAVRLGRFERRILAAIVAVALVTLGGALWFGQGAVSEAYHVGVNARVLDQLERSLGIYRRHLVALREDAERTSDAVAFDRRLHAALEASDGAGVRRFLEGA